MHRYVAILLAVCLPVCANIHAQKEMRLPNWPVMAVPVINYTPETSWVFGGAAQAYFRIADQRTSIIQVDGAWTLNQQWYANVQGTIYAGNTRPFTIQFKAGYRDYPDRYYGIGNEPNIPNSIARTSEAYLSRRLYATITPLIGLSRAFYIGPHVDMLYEQIQMSSTGQSKVVSMPGIGASIVCDTRDEVYYPKRGVFFKLAATHYNRVWGASASLTRTKADFRHFVHLGATVVLAYEACADIALAGKQTVPFQMLPAIGGQDLIRGIPAGMFRDNTALALQAELRFPIWQWLRGCAFVGAGDVYNIYDWHFTTPKIGYGVGLRVTINSAKVNIRADVARNNLFPSWTDQRGYAFYLTATEAF